MTLDWKRDLMTLHLRKETARRALAGGLALGVLADLLLRATPWGWNATLWILALSAVAMGTAARRPPDGVGAPPPRGALAAAAPFALVFAWRASPPLLVLCGAAVLVTLAAGLLARPARSGVLAWALSGIAGAVSAGLGTGVAAYAGSRDLPGPRAVTRRVLTVLIGTALAAPLLVVFGSLFASADPVFEHALRGLLDPLDDVLRHGGVILLAGWLAAGALVALTAIRVPGSVGLGAPRSAAGPVLVALGLLDLLFLAFLAVQARALAGGHAYVETTAGLSYAEYARGGFFQLVACGAIALPPLLAADWAVPPGTSVRRRLVILAGGLALLVLAVLASAVRRLGLYVGAYGLTEDRFYASAFLAWLAIAGVLFGLTVLRGRRGRFGLGALASALAVLAALALVNPEAAIVRYNAARPGPEGFDATYATTLGADAVPALLDVGPGLASHARCRIAESLLQRWGGAGDGWRTWNLARWRARGAVADAHARLESWSCPPPATTPPAGRGSPGPALQREESPPL